MVHILLLILKIIGITLLVVLGILLLILLFPVTYKISGQLDGKDYSLKIKAGWLFSLLHFSLNVEKKQDMKMKFRILGIPVNIFNREKKQKKKTKKHKKEEKEGVASEKAADELPKQNITENKRITDDEEQENANIRKEEISPKEEKRESSDNGFLNKIKKLFLRIKNTIKRIIANIKKTANDIQGMIDKVKHFKKVITSSVTKKAYRYAKNILKKLFKHIMPGKIKADINFGFEEPDLTGKTLGYIAVTASAFNVNMKRINIVPDFEKSVLKGRICMKGHIVVGIVLIYLMKLYFNKEIHYLVKKYL